MDSFFKIKIKCALVYFIMNLSCILYIKNCHLLKCFVKTNLQNVKTKSNPLKIQSVFYNTQNKYYTYFRNNRVAEMVFEFAVKQD